MEKDGYTSIVWPYWIVQVEQMQKWKSFPLCADGKSMYWERCRFTVGKKTKGCTVHVVPSENMPCALAHYLSLL